MRTTSVLAFLVVALVAAGCTSKGPVGDAAPSTTPTGAVAAAPSFSLSSRDLPAVASAGQLLPFTLSVTGPSGAESDHVGAHFGPNASAPVASAMDACPHQSGALPGTFPVECTIPRAGTWFVYGHARTGTGDAMRDHWAEPRRILVYDYVLKIDGLPQTARVGEDVTFPMTVRGGPSSDSTHVGAHYDDNGTRAPIASQMHECAHVSGAAPGDFSVTCRFDTAGTWHVRGHYRLTEGASTADFWSAPIAITVR